METGSRDYVTIPKKPRICFCLRKSVGQ